ncbi:MAG: chromate resistance protein b, partial [Burkholderiales bacterium]|nr:chromate resistance protein b [Burkholderiales bacterium]
MDPAGGSPRLDLTVGRRARRVNGRLYFSSLFCDIYYADLSDLAALVLSLPARNSTLRMRLWRALKQTGCGILRDGVYLLPSGGANDEALARLEAE